MDTLPELPDNLSAEDVEGLGRDRPTAAAHKGELRGGGGHKVDHVVDRALDLDRAEVDALRFGPDDALLDTPAG